MHRSFLFAALSILPAAAFAPTTAFADDAAIIADVDARYDETAFVARQLWEWAEVGYQEERSSQLLQDKLAAAGFSVRKGVADIPTAFIAEYGKGGPVIAILAEFDARQTRASHVEYTNNRTVSDVS